MSRLLTTKEIADQLRVTVKTVGVWCREGKIPFTTIPGRNGYEYRFDYDEVRRVFVTDWCAGVLEKRSGDKSATIEDRQNAWKVAQNLRNGTYPLEQFLSDARSMAG